MANRERTSAFNEEEHAQQLRMHHSEQFTHVPSVLRNKNNPTKATAAVSESHTLEFPHVDLICSTHCTHRVLDDSPFTACLLVYHHHRHYHLIV